MNVLTFKSMLSCDTYMKTAHGIGEDQIALLYKPPTTICSHVLFYSSANLPIARSQTQVENHGTKNIPVLLKNGL